MLEYARPFFDGGGSVMSRVVVRRLFGRDLLRRLEAREVQT